MSSMPYRHQEILQALADNPKGLTTGQVFRHCRAVPGSELPDDSGVVSKILFVLRNTHKYVTSSDAAGGIVHKITPRGKEALAEVAAQELNKATDNAIQKADNKPAEPEPDPDPHGIGELFNTPNPQTILTLDPGNELDAPFIQIISALRAAYELPAAPHIKRKELKIDTLIRLGALMSADIHAIFAEIVEDLEQLEELA